MNAKWKIILIVMASLLIRNESIAATLNVGPSQAYSTIQSAIGAAQSGDTIIVYAGTYVEDLTVNKSILLQNNPGASPVVQGKISANANNVTISGLEVTGWSYPSHGIAQTGYSGLTISNCRIYNVGGSGSASCIYSRNSTKVTISNNEIYKCNKGININSGHSTDNTYANGIIIDGNTVHDNPNDGIDIQGQYITVSNNNVYNNMDSNWVATHPDGIQLIASTVDGYTTVQHAIIKNNIFRNHTQNIFVEGTLTGDASDCSDIHIYNNVVYNEQSGTVNGVDLSTFSNTNVNIKRGKNIYFYNNTVGATKGNGLYVPDGATNSIYIKNNIFQGSNNAVYVMVPASIAEMDYNQYNPTKTSIKWDTTYYSTATLFHAAYPAYEQRGQNGDPKLLSWPQPLLQNGSPCIGKGANLGADYALDKNGIPRSNTGAWDIGAYSSAYKIPMSPGFLRFE